MKKILLVTREYYPNNSPGANRIHAFARHLPAFGFEPTILTVDWNQENCARFWKANCYDAGLEGSEVCRTVRVPFMPAKPSPIDATMRHLRPLWAPGGLDKRFIARGTRLLKEEKFDIILATSPPPLSLKTGSRLSRIAAIPWVVDFRDITGQHCMHLTWTHPWRYRRWIWNAWAFHCERKVCRTAAAILTVSKPLAEQLGRRGLSNVHVVANGFEPDNFAAIARNKTNVFRIVYTGTLSSGRDPSPLFNALDLLLGEGVIVDKDFEACFFGQSPEAFEPYLQGHSCRSLVKLAGRKIRSEILRITVRASLLLQLAHAHERGILTSKVFEYLGAGRPILSVPKDGDVIDALLDETGAGQSATEPREIADIVARYYRQWKETGAVEYAARPEAVARYTRKAQTEIIAAVLDDALEQTERKKQ